MVIKNFYFVNKYVKIYFNSEFGDGKYCLFLVCLSCSQRLKKVNKIGVLCRPSDLKLMVVMGMVR